jgi:hypothetical protein
LVIFYVFVQVATRPRLAGLSLPSVQPSFALWRHVLRPLLPDDATKKLDPDLGGFDRGRSGWSGFARLILT